MADKKVVIYSTPTCPYCKRAKEYLSRKGISYQEYNVAVDRDKAKEMIQKSGQMGVPVIIVDSEVVVGFNQVQLDKLLLSALVDGLVSFGGSGGNHVRFNDNRWGSSRPFSQRICGSQATESTAGKW